MDSSVQQAVSTMPPVIRPRTTLHGLFSFPHGTSNRISDSTGATGAEMRTLHKELPQHHLQTNRCLFWRPNPLLRGNAIINSDICTILYAFPCRVMGRVPHAAVDRAGMNDKVAQETISLVSHGCNRLPFFGQAEIGVVQAGCSQGRPQPVCFAATAAKNRSASSCSCGFPPRA